jgi:CheY-like chemotaxis protein
LKALIVDDEASVRAVLEIVLKNAELDFDIVDSAEDALDRLASGIYDVLLTDDKLPGMTGLELIHRLRQHDKTTACLLMSSSGARNVASFVEPLGGDGFISKPFADVFSLVQELRKAVDQRRRRSA